MRLESYDLFDTLITRSTKTPRGVFQLLQLSQTVVFRWRILGIIPFQVWRRHAEHIARRLSHRDDICITDIYRVLGWIIKTPSRVMRQEITLEKAVIQPIPFMISQLRNQHDQGVRCCIVSDMYLHESTIRSIIKKHILNIPVYVSSRHGITKATGKLFQHVAHDQAIDLESIHHQGDNQAADYEAPLRLGIRATLTKKPEDKSSCSSLDVLKCPNEDPFYAMGFKVAGPAAFVMAKGLDIHVSRQPPNNIVFAARDMHLVFHAFNCISQFKKTSYLRISRSAVYHAQWHATKNPEKWFEGVSNGRDFFSRLGIECPTELSSLNPYVHSQRFLAELERSGFMQKCSDDYDIVRSYLFANGLGPGTLFVDLGWRGSIQDSIEQIIGPKISLKGWYFGTIRNKNPKPKIGFYFNNARPIKRLHKVLQSISFFEFIFTEDIASLARIDSFQGKFISIFTEDESPEQINARNRIAEGARAYIDAMVSLDKVTNFQTDRLINELDKVFNKYLMNPPTDWITAMESMTHSGGFGGSGKCHMIGDDAGTFLGFLKSTWKGGYLQKHPKAASTRLMRMAHHHLFFVFYEFLKSVIRYFRKKLIHRQVKTR